MEDEAAEWSSRFASAPIDAMQAYEDIFVPGLLVPWANLLLDEVAVAPGETVLDVACGPGTVTRLAAARVGKQGRVTGADISVRAQARTLEAVFEGGATRFAQTLAALPAGPEVAAMSPRARAELERAAERHLGSLVSGGQLRCTSTANVAVARS